MPWKRFITTGNCPNTRLASLLSRAKKRAAMLTVVKSTVEATKQDLEVLSQQLASFEAGRITEDTSVGELEDRFPAVAKEIEEEIKNHEWQKDSM